VVVLQVMSGQVIAESGSQTIGEQTRTTKISPSAKGVAVVLVSLVAMFVIDWMAPLAWSWGLTMITWMVMLIAIGLAVNGRIGGVLIDEQNLFSLSRFQTVLWTVIILSGYTVLVISRIRQGVADPLAVSIDQTLWSLMGISTASLVGSPLISAVKKQKTPAKTEIEKTARALVAHNNAPSIRTDGTATVQAVVDASSQGILYSNPRAADASLFDMLEGEEVGNAACADLGKIQMCFFTIITAVAYSAALIASLQQKTTPDTLPLVSPGMLALLGISNAGFLANKGVDHTKQSLT
jgi:hypothetical protein